MTYKRPVRECVICKKQKPIYAYGRCSSCNFSISIRENPHLLEKKREHSRRYNRKIAGIPLDAPVKFTNNQRIINYTEAWCIQYLLDRGYEIRKKDET